MYDKFTFDTHFNKGKYTAEKFDREYKVHWDNDYLIYSKSTVDQHITRGDWFNVKEVVDKPKNQFSIKKGQIEAAARFIIANNKYMHYHTVDSMSAKIKSYIKDMVDKINSGKESYYCATAGFIISIGLEDTNYYTVEVLVDPSVSSDEEFVYVEEII